MFGTKNGNGHTRSTPERALKIWRTGQWIVVDDVWNGVVDGPFEAEVDGFAHTQPGRRVVRVFGNEPDAMAFAQACVERNIEEFGDI